jgi:hypothetical protein
MYYCDDILLKYDYYCDDVNSLQTLQINTDFVIQD